MVRFEAQDYPTGESCPTLFQMHLVASWLVLHSRFRTRQRVAGPPPSPAGLFFCPRPRSNTIATDRNASRKAAERRFPHCIDVPVPGSGLGNRLTEMLAWCRENVPAGTWDHHHHRERRKGEPPADFARFYFLYEAVGEAFRRRWR